MREEETEEHSSVGPVEEGALLILTACARSVLVLPCKPRAAAPRVTLTWRKRKDVNLTNPFVFSLLEP